MFNIEEQEEETKLCKKNLYSFLNFFHILSPLGNIGSFELVGPQTAEMKPRILLFTNFVEGLAKKLMLCWMLNRILCCATVWDHKLNGSFIHLINSLLGKNKTIEWYRATYKKVFISLKWTVSTAFPSACSSSPTGQTCVFMHPCVGVLCACTVNASLFFTLNNGVTGTDTDFVLVIESFVTEQMWICSRCVFES